MEQDFGVGAGKAEGAIVKPGGPAIGRVLPGARAVRVSLRPAALCRWGHIQNGRRVPIDGLQELNQEAP